MKLTDAKKKQMEQDWKAYNRFLRQRHLTTITFDVYVKQSHGKVEADSKQKNEVYVQKMPIGYTDKKQYNSVSLTGLSVCGKKNPAVYSGERQLLGIATLHKSCLQPVFDKQIAIDVANMRRN